MTEADLDALLAGAARRVRVQRALRMGLLVLGLSTLAASGLIFWARINSHNTWLVNGALAAPLIAAGIALLAAFIRYHPNLQTVAMLIDERAHSDEHLVTWLDLRSRNDDNLDPLQRDFRDAQRTATLKKAGAFQISQLLPLRLPEWSRAILLAVLLLCCALLVPSQSNASRKLTLAPKDDSLNISLSQSGGGGGGPGGRQNKQAVIVNLSKEDIGKLRLIAFGNAPKETRLQAHKDMKSKLGNIPRSQLLPEVRDILAELEKDTGEQDKPDEKTASSAQRMGTSNPGQDSTSKGQGAAVEVPDYPERAFSAVRENFSDVDAPLTKYYRGQGSGDKGQ
jgi:hypothetical protein